MEAAAGPKKALAAARRAAASPPVTAVMTAARKATRRMRELGDEISNDERARLHDSLSATQFTILDLGGPSHSVQAELQRLERTERRLKNRSTHQPQRNDRTRVQRAIDAPVSCWHTLIARLRNRLWTFTWAPVSWAFLLLIGTLAAFAAFVADLPVAKLSAVRGAAVSSVGGGFAGYLLWTLWCAALSLASAGMCFLVPQAEGSGIPQLKAILAGTPSLDRFLDFRVGAAKMAGLVLAQGAGLSVGKEGPFVHIAACLASALWSLPSFSSIKHNETLRRQMLSAAVAAGVTGVFGTPIGAVLFGVEVTSSYLLVSNLGRAFVVAVICRLVFDLISTFRNFYFFTGTSFPEAELSVETIAFVGLGVLCGLLGSLCVFAINRVRALRGLLIQSTRSRFLVVAAAALLVATATYLTRYTRKSDRDAVNDLFSDATTSAYSLSDWGGGASIIGSLLVYLTVKLAATIVSVNLPISCGIFMPLFTLGAAAGRLYGEALKLSFPTIMPGAYSVVGAASLVSGATGTISTAVMVFEMTGQLSHLLPVLLGVLVAHSVSSVFTVSVYDLLLLHSRLPYLPRVLHSSVYSWTAADIMIPAVTSDAGGGSSSDASDASPTSHVLSLDSTYADAKALLDGAVSDDGALNPSHLLHEYPVVDSLASMTLIGSVSREVLRRAIVTAEEQIKRHVRDPDGTIIGDQGRLADSDSLLSESDSESDTGSDGDNHLDAAAATDGVSERKDGSDTAATSDAAAVAANDGDGHALASQVTESTPSPPLHASSQPSPHLGVTIDSSCAPADNLALSPSAFTSPLPARTLVLAPPRLPVLNALAPHPSINNSPLFALQRRQAAAEAQGGRRGLLARALGDASEWVAGLFGHQPPLTEEQAAAAEAGMRTFLVQRIRFDGVPKQYRRRMEDDSMVPLGPNPLQPAAAPDTAASAPPKPPPPRLRLDPSPFELPPGTPLHRVHYLFAMCPWHQMYVTTTASAADVTAAETGADPGRQRQAATTNPSRLLGVLTRESLALAADRATGDEYVHDVADGRGGREDPPAAAAGEPDVVGHVQPASAAGAAADAQRPLAGAAV